MTILQLPDATHTQTLGSALASALQQLNSGAAIALKGDLGAGKTTLTRALLRAADYSGPVVSPSYTLVEPYELEQHRLLHLDLYRIGDPEELEYLGWREWDAQRDWIIVEWPERGAGFLPDFDLVLSLAYSGEGRVAELKSVSERGQSLLVRVVEAMGQ